MFMLTQEGNGIWKKGPEGTYSHVPSSCIRGFSVLAIGPETELPPGSMEMADPIPKDLFSGRNQVRLCVLPHQIRNSIRDYILPDPS
jgi:hypothetical protein